MLSIALIRALSASTQGLRRLAGKVTMRVGNRRALYQMDNLDDHLLQDIGLTRADLSAAHACAWYCDPYSLSPFADRRSLIQAAGNQGAPVKHLQTEAQVEQPCCSHLTGAAV